MESPYSQGGEQSSLEKITERKWKAGEKSRHERNFEDKYKCLVPFQGAIFSESAQGAGVGFNQEDPYLDRDYLE